MKKIIALVTIPLLMTQCVNDQKTDMNTTENEETAKEKQYTPEMVVNKKDFVCGMPTTAGISDTAHYQGNAYGFCSAECKAAFVKDPATYLASK